MVKEIGRFNVDYAGLIYDGRIPYNMIIISEFDDADKFLGKKTFYFYGEVLDFETEEEVEEVYSLPISQGKLRVERSLVIQKMI